MTFKSLPSKRQLVITVLLLLFFSLHVALLLGGEEETMPARPGHTHSEDLPWLEVPQPISSDEKESDNCGSMVPSICGETF